MNTGAKLWIRQNDNYKFEVTSDGEDTLYTTDDYMKATEMCKSMQAFFDTIAEMRQVIKKYSTPPVIVLTEEMEVQHV